MSAVPQTALPTRPVVNWNRVRRVLLIRLRSIGDTVLMTPCLEALRRWQPGIEIGVVTEPLAAPVIAGHVLIDELIVVKRTFASRLASIARIRSWKPDLVFNLHGGSTGMIMAALSGAYYTVGFRGQTWSWLLSTPAPSPEVMLSRGKIHTVEQQLALLSWTGVPIPEHAQLNISQACSGSAESLRGKLLSGGLDAAFLRSRQLACVAPGAAFESKRFQAQGFSSIIDHLSDRWNIKSLVLAGPGQEDLAIRVAGSSRTGALALSGLSLDEVKVLLGSYVHIFVGNDGGPMHIAAASGCPVVGVFGSSNPDVWRPWSGAPYEVVGGERGTPDGNVRGSIDRIDVESVLAAVDRVMQQVATVSALLE